MPAAATVQYSRKGLSFWATFLPPFAWMGVLYFIPLGVLLTYAFRHHEYVNVTWELTLENFTVAFSKSYRPALFRTFYLAAIVTAIDLVLAFPVAWFLAFKAGRFKHLLTLLILLPLWSSYLVRVFAWRIILGYNGVLNSVLRELHILEKPSEAFLFNSFSMGLTLCYIWLPFMILPLVTALERLPTNLLEASNDLGGGPIYTFRRVVLPIVLPGLLAGSLSVFSLTSGDYITPQLIGGGHSLVGNLVAEQFGAVGNWPLGAAFSVLVLIVLFLLMAVLARWKVLENA